MTTLRQRLGRLTAAVGLSAALASTPASAQEPAAAAPPPEPTAETIDLGALGVQDESQAAGTGERPLQIYGFADFTYAIPFIPQDSLLGATLPPNQQFAMGKFNIYIAKELSSRLRSLGEVRFSYMPNGSADPTQPVGRISTDAQDPTDIYRIQRWGSILIERLQLDYDLLPMLTIRAGQFLTPYGIWNVDHGTPTLIGIHRPYIIGEALFPERQVGLELIGRHFWSELGVEYHLTLSNGRGPMSESRELDTNKAVGGRLVLGWKRGFADVKLGFSFYRGTYTNRTQPAFDLATQKTLSTILERYTEQSVGADLSVDASGFVFRGEFISADRRFEDNFRGTTAWTPDNRRWGIYGIAGYRLPFNLLPYVVFEHYVFPQIPQYVYIDQVQVYRGGLNYRLHPSVILKLEYSYAPISSPSATRLPGGATFDFVTKQPYESLEAQVTWVF